MPRNVWVLTLAQAFAMSATPMMMLLGGLIGAQLAPTPALSTLPIAVMVIGVALSVVPVSRLMRPCLNVSAQPNCSQHAAS